MSTLKVAIACSTEYKDYAFNEKSDIWTLVSLKAPMLEEKDGIEKRAPIDIVAVIDKSGSMAGEKLCLVKKTLEFVVSQLNGEDQLCLVTYDSNVNLDFKLMKMNKDNKDIAIQVIKAISAGSMTNLCGGLMKGLCQVIDRSAEGKNQVASVLLFTDGLANEGITHTNGIIAAMKDPKTFDGPSAGSQKSYQFQNPKPKPPQSQSPHLNWLKKLTGSTTEKTTPTQVESTSTLAQVESKSPIATVYTFGFGSDHNAEMLKEISDAGDGMYYFIENTDKIPEAFGHCLGGLLSTVAQSIQLEILMENGVSIKEVHSNRPIDQQGNRVKVNMGDLQSEESRDVVLELSINPLDSPTECQTLFNANLNYFNVITECLESSHAMLTVLRPKKAEDHSETNSNAEVNKQRSRVNLTKTMKVVYDKAEEGDFEYANSLLNTEIQSLKLQSARTNNVENQDYYGAMINDVLGVASNLSSKSQWNAKGKSANLNMVQTHACQRSSNLESVSYMTKAKASKQSFAKKFISK